MLVVMSSYATQEEIDQLVAAIEREGYTARVIQGGERTAIGILIVQDLVAVAILSFTGNNELSPWAILLLGFVLLKPVLHKVLDLTGHDELLVLFGLLLALVVGAGSFQLVGFSSELGALIIGVLIAGHPRATELSNSLWGLKEVMLIGFFCKSVSPDTPPWKCSACRWC